jgi:hypothetical protein
MNGAVSLVKGASNGAFKARLVFLAWIAGLFAALALLWVLTQPAQQRYLMRAINNVFIAAGDSRRVVSPASAPAGGPPGFWYSLMDSKDRLFVFGIMRDGILIPCGARVNESGKVEELLPLGFHAAHTLNTLSQGILRIYVRRIESALAELPARLPGSFTESPGGKHE